MMPQTHWREADRDTFARAWAAEVAEVPEFTDSTIHIVAGLLLPIWKRLPERVDPGLSAPDRRRRAHHRPQRLARVGRQRVRKPEPSTLSPDAAFAALIDGKTILDLAEGLQLRRVRVMGANRIELTGFTEPMRDRLRAYGLFGEIISWKLPLLRPSRRAGPAILAKVLERYPIARIADRAAT